MAEINEELIKRYRHLPHWQLGDSVYFVTFRSARGVLPPAALSQVTTNILYDHRRRYDLHLAVVMPDHAHLIIQPLRKSVDEWWPLEEILKSLKGVSARRINQLLGTSGHVWQEEYFDRIIRNANEYDQIRTYMWNNPVKALLVEHPEDWPFHVLPPEA